MTEQQAAYLAGAIAHANDSLDWIEARRPEPCALGLEYRDGVVCSAFGGDDACTSHQVVRGLRKHSVDADRWELRARMLAKALMAAQGIIHEGLHGGSPTVPEHQAACERPACKRIRAALAGQPAAGGA